MPETQNPELPLHERLLLAGIEEVSTNGVQNFSVRRVAASCGVSCAAPYKHFKDKSHFIASIVDYINGLWAQRQREILEEIPGPPRKQLVAISCAYIRFLTENPHFRSVVMLKDDSIDKAYENMRTKLSPISQDIIQQYCKSVGMSPEVAQIKTFIVRSLIYGAALMFDNGEIPYTEEMFDRVAKSIDREFDLD